MGCLQSLKKKALSDSKVNVEYEALEKEYKLINSSLSARESLGLQQKEVVHSLGGKSDK